MKKILSLSLIVLLLISCSEDEETAPPAPAIPPETSLVMPFESFEPEGGRVESMINAGLARLTVAFWQLFSIPLLIPAAAFEASFSQVPSFSNGEWIWNYEFTAVGVKHRAELHATIANSGSAVNWEMYISKEGEFDDFLWFEGTSQLDGLSGNWVLNESPDKPTKILDIVWSKNIDNTQAEIRYTNIEGGYINYGINQANDPDTFYIIRGNDGGIVEILWDSEKKNGQITGVDGNVGCWNSSFEDVDC